MSSANPEEFVTPQMASPDVIIFMVRGLPVPQGSSRGFFVKGRVVITSSNKNLKTWRQLVSDVAQKYAPSPLWDGPLMVKLAFNIPPRRTAVKPPCVCSHLPSRHKLKDRFRYHCRDCNCVSYRESKQWPTTKPDLDKLIRSILDSMTNIIFRDDNQVVEIIATKEYGDPGVSIEVRKKGRT
jgi:Holliday junction resolvase RusA-like endonuclease